MIFLSSDHHWHHVNIIKYCKRPYNSVFHMDEDLIERWNSVVTNDDIVYYLGDFSMSPQYVERNLQRLNRKEIHLIHGNHDRTFKQKSYVEKYEAWGFDSVATETFTDFGLGGYLFRLNHLPYPGNDHTYVDRYKEKRPLPEVEDWLLCGHIHEKWKQKDNMINVGVDVWDYTPVSLDRILELIEG